MNAIVRIRATPALMLRSALLLGALLLGACSGGGSGGNSGGIPAINRSLIDGPITLTEGGAAKFYTVVLNSAPSADVSITLTTGSHIVVTPSAVTFTPATWNVSQDITVAAVDDAVADGAHSDVIVHHVSSADSGYAPLTLGDIQVDIADNDVIGVAVAESAGGTQVAEGGSGDDYTLALRSQPAADVTITVNGGNLLTVAPTTLTFTPGNWNIAQPVSVDAINNSSVEGAHSTTITHATSSADSRYNGIAVAAVTAQIIDDDTVATLEFLGDAAVAVEGDGTVTVPMRLRLNASVALSAPVSGSIVVLPSSTVINNSDVTPLTSGVNFGAGSHDGDIQNLVVSIRDDTIKEAIETADLRLGAAIGVGAVLGDNLEYQLQLHDNELPQLIASSVDPVGGYHRSTLLGIDPVTAAARRLSGLGLAGVTAITGIAYDAAANVLYAASGGELMKINFYTGVASLIGPTAVTAGLAFNPVTGVLYGSDRSRLYTVNTSTAVATVVGSYGGFSDVEGLAFDDNGILYGSDTTANTLLTIDTTSGAATAAASGFGVSGLASLAYDGANHTLYAASTVQDKLYTVSAGGVATAVGAQALGYANVVALAYAATSDTLYGFDTTTRQLLTINMTSGVAQTSKVTGYGTSTGIQLSGLAFDANHQLFYGVDTNALGDQYLLHMQAATGTASAVAKITGVSGTLYDLAYDPNANRLYGVNGSSLYRIDTDSAAATLVGSTGASPRGLAFDAFNNILYASDISADQLLRLNTSSGTATVIGTGFGAGYGDIEGLAFDPVAVKLYGINTDPVGKNPRLVTVNTTSGIASPVGAVLHEDVRGALAYDSVRNRLYGADQLGLLRLDTSNGRGSSIGQLGFDQLDDIAYNPASGVLYGVVSDSDGGKLITVDLATGTATPVGNLGISCCVDGLAFKPSTGALYALDTATGNLLSINVNTGAASVVGPVTGFDGVAGALAYDPGHDRLYGIGVIDAGGSGTGPYSYRLITINTGNGTGTVVATTGTDVITALAYDPVGAKLYAYDDTTGRIVTLDTASGAATNVGNPVYTGIKGLTWRY